jgi:hypothetical protein
MKLKAVGFVLVATLAMVAPSNALEQPVVNDGDLMACKNIGDACKSGDSSLDPIFQREGSGWRVLHDPEGS